MTKSDEEELARRIQRRILSETRQKLTETEGRLKIVNEQVAHLIETLTSRDSAMKQTMKEAEDALALSKEKDDKIKMLQQRVTNVNKEYNRAYGGKRAILPQEESGGSPQLYTPVPPPRHPISFRTTLEEARARHSDDDNRS